MYSATTEIRSKYYGNSGDLTLAGEIGLHLFNYGEYYEFKFPPIVASGIFLGTAKIERVGKLKIRCKKSKLKAIIQYESGGKIKGTIKNLKKEKLVTVAGNLNNCITFVYTKTGEKEYVSLDKLYKNKTPKIVAPFEEQQENESRRVWHNVAYAIYENDMKAAAKA